MRMTRTLTTLILLIFLSTSVEAIGQESDGCCPGICDLSPGYWCSGAQCTVRFSWKTLSEGKRLTAKELASYAAQGSPTRIDAGTVMTVKVVGFNHLDFALETSVETRKVEAYAQLEKLWQQVFRLGGVGLFDRMVADSGPQVIAKIASWRLALAQNEQRLDALLRNEPPNPQDKLAFRGRVALTCDDMAAMAAAAATARKWQDQATTAATAAADALQAAIEANSLTIEVMSVYEDTVEKHDRVMARFAEFHMAAQLIQEGTLVVLGKQESGNVVTATFSAKDRKTTATRATGTIEYFSHSKLPVTFHAGLGINGLDDVEYEKIRVAGGSQLFTAVKDQAETSTLTAFMTYRWRRLGRLPLNPTLGTDLAKPGERLYGGLTFELGPALLTLGYVSGSVTELTGSVNEPLGGLASAAGVRELFEQVAQKRRYEPFASISFDPFR